MSWEMTVPVISIGHLPENYQELIAGKLFADYDEGVFVYMNHFAESEDPCFKKIFAWFSERYPDQAWVRFDAHADTVDGLEVFNW